MHCGPRTIKTYERSPDVGRVVGRHLKLDPCEACVCVIFTEISLNCGRRQLPQVQFTALFIVVLAALGTFNLHLPPQYYRAWQNGSLLYCRFGLEDNDTCSSK